MTLVIPFSQHNYNSLYGRQRTNKISQQNMCQLSFICEICKHEIHECGGPHDETIHKRFQLYKPKHCHKLATHCGLKE